MKLTEYSKDIKNYVEAGLRTIENDGFVIGLNNDVEYWNKEEFLDACVENLVGVVLSGEVEKDCGYVFAFKESGVVNGYLQSTNILGKMVGGKIGNIFGKEG